MGFRCGTVGLPNAGKSTLFSALTKAGIETANFPFCVVESNTGVVPMPDPRLDKLAEIVEPRRILLTTMEFIDIVGLVKGVSKGEGLDNQFLISIHGTEVIGYMVRCFENDSVVHVSNKVGPADGIDVINTELAFSDLDTCECVIHRVQKKTRDGDEDAKVELAVLERYLPQLENAGILRSMEDLTDEDKVATKYPSLLTLKPTMYIVNANEDGFENNSHLDKVRKVVAAGGSVVATACVAAESDIAELDDADRDEFMTELGLGEPGLNRVIRAGYELLSLQTYFIAGVEEAHAWTIPAGTAAPQATGKIHTDFEKGFIRVQATAYGDFITYKGGQGAKEAGKMRAEGEDYIVKDGDVMNFLFNV